MALFHEPITDPPYYTYAGMEPPAELNRQLQNNETSMEHLQTQVHEIRNNTMKPGSRDMCDGIVNENLVLNLIIFSALMEILFLMKMQLYVTLTQPMSLELASFCLESIPEFILVVVYSPNGDKPFQNNILHVQDIKATCNELNTYLDSKIPFVFEFHVPIHSNKRTLLSCPTIPLAKQATYLAILLEPELHTEFEELTFKTMKYLENEWKEDRLLEIGFVSWFNTQANKDTIMFIWNYLIGNNLIQFVHVKTKQWFYPNHSLISIMMANANQSNMLQIPEEFQSIRAALDVNNNPSIQIENCNPDIENVNENLIKIVDKLFPNCKFTLDTNHQCSINNPKGGYKGVFTINNQLYLETSELYDSPTIAKEQVIQFAYDYVSIMFDMKIKCEDDNPIRAISQIAQSLKKKLEWVFEDNKCILILDGAQYVSSPKNTKNDAKLEAAKIALSQFITTPANKS